MVGKRGMYWEKKQILRMNTNGKVISCLAIKENHKFSLSTKKLIFFVDSENL